MIRHRGELRSGNGEFATFPRRRNLVTCVLMVRPRLAFACSAGGDL